MATNTYKLPNNEPTGIFSWLEKFLRIDSTMAEVIHVRFMPQILFITLLSVIYIGNRHLAEKKIRNITQLETEVNDLQADFISLKAEFMLASKQSEVAQQAERIGLVAPKEAPTKVRAIEE